MTRGRLLRAAAVAAVAVAGGLRAVEPPPAAAGIDGEVLHARSTDGGRSFRGPANLSGDTDRSDLPHAAAGGGVVHLVWKRGEEGDIVHRRSTDGGRRFSPRMNLTRNEADSSEPDVAAAGGAVVVVWAEEDASGEDEVFATAGSDGGSAFGARTPISASPGRSSRDPDIAADDGLVVVSYEEGSDDEDIFVARSRDAGSRWARPVNVSRAGTRAVESAVAVQGATVHVVWEARGDELDPADDAIGYARSLDGGATFSAPALLPAATALHRPAVAADGDIVHVVSCSPADKSGLFASDAYYSASRDGGGTWNRPVNLSVNPGDCKTPAVAAARGQVYVAWGDSTPGRTDVLLRRSPDRGTTFGRVVNVSDSAGDSDDVAMAVDADSGDVHVVWVDFSVTSGAATTRR